MEHITSNNFDEKIKKDRVLVDFYATWCGPCKMLSPVFESVSEEIKDTKFIKVDVDKFEELCRNYKVMSVPTLILFENGKEVKRKIGFIPKEQLIKFINE